MGNENISPLWIPLLLVNMIFTTIGAVLVANEFNFSLLSIFVMLFNIIFIIHLYIPNKSKLKENTNEDGS